MRSTAQQAAFRALADPTRRSILSDLTSGEKSIADIASRFAMTRAAVRKHMSVLEEGGLIAFRAEGRERLAALTPAPLKAAHDWIGLFSPFWDDRLDALKTAAEAEAATATQDEEKTDEGR